MTQNLGAYLTTFRPLLEMISCPDGPVAATGGVVAHCSISHTTGNCVAIGPYKSRGKPTSISKHSEAQLSLLYISHLSWFAILAAEGLHPQDHASCCGRLAELSLPGNLDQTSLEKAVRFHEGDV